MEKHKNCDYYCREASELAGTYILRERGNQNHQFLLLKEYHRVNHKQARPSHRETTPSKMIDRADDLYQRHLTRLTKGYYRTRYYKCRGFCINKSIFGSACIPSLDLDITLYGNHCLVYLLFWYYWTILTWQKYSLDDNIYCYISCILFYFSVCHQKSKCYWWRKSRVPEENYWPNASHRQTSSHKVVSIALCHGRE